MPSFLGVGDILFQSVAINDRIADHGDDRRTEFRRHAASHLQNLGQLDFVFQRPRVRGLNDGPVGNRVAVRNAQFAQTAAAVH